MELFIFFDKKEKIATSPQLIWIFVHVNFEKYLILNLTALAGICGVYSDEIFYLKILKYIHLHVNVVILKGKPHVGFFEKWTALFF